jgi:hypothetical protein
METIPHKRGEPFNLIIDGLDGAKQPYAIPSDWTAVSKLARERADGPTVKTFAPTISGGKIVINDSLDNLPPGIYVMDVKLLDAAQNSIAVSDNVIIDLDPSPSTPYA